MNVQRRVGATLNTELSVENAALKRQLRSTGRKLLFARACLKLLTILVLPWRPVTVLVITVLFVIYIVRLMGG